MSYTLEQVFHRILSQQSLTDCLSFLIPGHRFHSCPCSPIKSTRFSEWIQESWRSNQRNLKRSRSLPHLWPIWKCIYLGIFERIKSLDRSSRSAKRSDPVQLVLWFACLCLWCLPFDQHQHFWNLKKRNLFIDFLYIFYPGFQTMLHLGLGLSRLTLASRAAQQASVVSNGALVLNQQSLKALHTTPKLDLRISGAL